MFFTIMSVAERLVKFFRLSVARIARAGFVNSCARVFSEIKE